MTTGIVRFSPFEELDRLQKEVNRIFEDAYQPGSRRSGTNGFDKQVWAPSVDIAETKDELLVKAEVPGVNQEDIDIELTGDTLHLRGARKFENDDHKDNYVRIERSFGTFHRSFTLNTPIQADKVSASYKDGILTIHLPKSELTKPKKVLVNSQN